MSWNSEKEERRFFASKSPLVTAFTPSSSLETAPPTFSQMFSLAEINLNLSFNSSSSPSWRLAFSISWIWKDKISLSLFLSVSFPPSDLISFSISARLSHSFEISSKRLYALSPINLSKSDKWLFSLISPTLSCCPQKSIKFNVISFNVLRTTGTPLTLIVLLPSRFKDLERISSSSNSMSNEVKVSLILSLKLSNTASTRIVFSLLRISVLSAFAPSTKLKASIRILFPAPDCPKITLKPFLKSISQFLIRARFEIKREESIFLPPFKPIYQKALPQPH